MRVRRISSQTSFASGGSWTGVNVAGLLGTPSATSKARTTGYVDGRQRQRLRRHSADFPTKITGRHRPNQRCECYLRLLLTPRTYAGHDETNQSLAELIALQPSAS